MDAGRGRIGAKLWFEPTALAANGDNTSNNIGTYQVAVLAKERTEFSVFKKKPLLRVSRPLIGDGRMAAGFPIEERGPARE